MIKIIGASLSTFEFEIINEDLNPFLLKIKTASKEVYIVDYLSVLKNSFEFDKFIDIKNRSAIKVNIADAFNCFVSTYKIIYQDKTLFEFPNSILDTLIQPNKLPLLNFGDKQILIFVESNTAFSNIVNETTKSSAEFFSKSNLGGVSVAVIYVDINPPNHLPDIKDCYILIESTLYKRCFSRYETLFCSNNIIFYNQKNNEYYDFFGIVDFAKLFFYSILGSTGLLYLISLLSKFSSIYWPNSDNFYLPHPENKLKITNTDRLLSVSQRLHYPDIIIFDDSSRQSKNIYGCSNYHSLFILSSSLRFVLPYLTSNTNNFLRRSLKNGIKTATISSQLDTVMFD